MSELIEGLGTRANTVSAELLGEAVNVALDVLIDIMQDDEGQPRHRLDAAWTVVQLVNGGAVRSQGFPEVLAGWPRGG